MTEHADTGDATPPPQRAAGRSYMQAELQQLAADARRAAAEAGLTLLRSHCSLSGYRGVLRDSDSTVGLKNPYRAQVRRGGRRVTLGRFATAEEAALCYARSPEGEAEARLAFDSERQPKAHGPRSSAQRALTPHSNVPERAKREGPRGGVRKRQLDRPIHSAASAPRGWQTDGSLDVISSAEAREPEGGAEAARGWDPAPAEAEEIEAAVENLIRMKSQQVGSAEVY
mmetsp:Transcript_24026/g.71443  ORF Transcript_24026/g.71443 Transcript_24026/m.71443 type:complete len:228 (-) Transcript_24026:106-789(-)